MAKLTLVDQTEIDLKMDTNINGDVYEFVTTVDDYTALGQLSAKLTTENLATIKVEDMYGTEFTYHNFSPADENKFIIMKETGLGLTVMMRLHEMDEKDVQTDALLNIAQGVDDEKALTIKSVYPQWDTLIGKTVPINTKFVWYDKLYKTKQADMLIQKQWQPGTTGTEALYEYIDETHEGTYEDPIPYAGNMTLEKGKCYEQDGVVYMCTNGTGIAVYDRLEYLAAFVAQYTPATGTYYDPIIWYGGGLPIEEGKYYIQGDVLYIATASSEIAVWGDLSALATYVTPYVPKEPDTEPENPDSGDKSEGEDQTQEGTDDSENGETTEPDDEKEPATGEPGDSADNPIEWSLGSKLYNGKYYKDKDVVYLCIRDSGIELYYDLKDLVSGGYVQVVE